MTAHIEKITSIKHDHEKSNAASQPGDYTTNPNVQVKGSSKAHTIKTTYVVKRCGQCYVRMHEMICSIRHTKQIKAPFYEHEKRGCALCLLARETNYISGRDSGEKNSCLTDNSIRQQRRSPT